MIDPNKDTAEYIPAHEFADSFFAPYHVSIPMVFGAATHIGKVRSRNEDHFGVFKRQRETQVLMSSLPADELPTYDTFAYAIVVADGMGGMKSGEYASRLALQTMVELSGQATSWVMRITNIDAQQIEERADAYVQRMQQTIQEHSQANPAFHNMGTTWTSAHFLGRNAVVVHLGDSRAYVFREGELFRITRDQTMAERLIDAGMPAESVKNFRHIVFNSFGGFHDVRAKIHHLELEPSDQMLLCSDGLTDMVADKEIAAVLGRHESPQAACDALIDRALDKGGRDNITVIVGREE
jgi:protein phosphatase